jgi:prepilin-type N-terminal cleavage/methylation domain-containing protein
MSDPQPKTNLPASEDRSEAGRHRRSTSGNDKGYTLIEVIIALIIIMVALLGVVHAFTYAIAYNAGNSSRAQALALLQDKVEVLRSRKFTSSFMDPELAGHAMTAETVVAPNNFAFRVEVKIDNDPSTSDIEEEADLPNSSLKEISVTVSLEAPTPGWQSAVPVTAVLRRTRGN